MWRSYTKLPASWLFFRLTFTYGDTVTHLTKTFASVSIVWLGPEPALLSADPDEGNASEPSQVLHKCYGNLPISSGTSNDESHEGPASAVSAWAVHEVSKTDTFFWPKKTKRNKMKQGPEQLPL